MTRAITGLLLLACALGAGCRSLPEPHTFPAYAQAPLARDASIVLAPGFVPGQRFVFEDHVNEDVMGLGFPFEFLHSGVYEIVAAVSGIPAEIRVISLAGESATFRAGPTGDIEVDDPAGTEPGGLLRQRIDAIG